MVMSSITCALLLQPINFFILNSVGCFCGWGCF